MSSTLDGAVKTFRTALLGGSGSATPYVLQSNEQSPPSPVFSLTAYTSSGNGPGSHIVRLDCAFSDRSTGTAGSHHDHLVLFVFQEGEVIEQCSLFLVAGDTGRVAMSFTTNLGRAFHAGDTSQTGTQVAINGGRLFGFYGLHGETITQLGLIMEVPITSLELSNVVYAMQNASPTIIGPVALDTVTLSNYSPASQMAGMTRSYTVTTSSMWSFDAGLRPGVELTVSAGIPLVMDEAVGSSAETSTPYTYGQPHSRSQVFQYTVQAEVPAISQITADVTATHGTLTIAYTGTLRIGYADGSTAKRQLHGTYTGSTYYDVAVTYGAATPGDEIIARRAQGIAASLSLYGKRTLASQASHRGPHPARTRTSQKSPRLSINAELDKPQT